MADEDAQVSDEKVGQIQKQQQQNPSTTTAESFTALALDSELHTCVTQRFFHAPRGIKCMRQGI